MSNFAKAAVFLTAISLILSGCRQAPKVSSQIPGATAPMAAPQVNNNAPVTTNPTTPPVGNQATPVTANPANPPDGNQVASPAATINPNAPLVFAEPRQIGTPNNNAASPYLRAGLDGRLYVIWTEDDRTSGTSNATGTPGMNMSTSNRNVFAAVSADGAQTWSIPVQVNDKPAGIEAEENPPKIAIANSGQVYAVWGLPNEKNDKMRANVNFASANADLAFTQPAIINNVTNIARFPSLEISPDGTIFIPWIDRRVDNPAPRRIYLTRISPTGQVLSTNVNIGGPACECCRLSLAFADGGKTVYIAYRENALNIRDIVIQKSTDGGITFGNPVLISNDGWYTEVCPHSGPVIAVDTNGNLHVTWWTPGSKPQDTGIYYTVSRDGGQTFAPRKLIDAANGTGALRAFLSVTPKGDIYFSWSNFVNDTGETQIFFRHLSPDGVTLSPLQQLSKVKGNIDDRPYMVVSGGKIYTAWTETKGDQRWAVMTSAPVPN